MKTELQLLFFPQGGCVAFTGLKTNIATVNLMQESRIL
jgi:hypothetical protein